MVILILLYFSSLTCLAAVRAMRDTAPTSLCTLVIALRAIRGLFFSSSRRFKFYVYFEITLLPIFLILLGWGYQTERGTAAKALITYTIFGSMPLLTLLLISLSSGFFFFSQLLPSTSSPPLSSFATFSCTFAFLVKVPIAFLHMWLPKAHLEAPVVGSIFLAAILLKLGGYGLVRFSSYLDGSVGLVCLISRVSL